MISKSQKRIADMLRAAGRKVTVIDETKDATAVADERLRKAQATIETLADALAALLPLAEECLADLRIDKRESERDGFPSAELDGQEEGASGAVADARAALLLAGRLP